MQLRQNIILFASIILFAFTSCEQKDSKNDDAADKEELSSFYFSYFKELKNVLGVVRYGDTITITIGFSDCGEWGGHQEKIFLFSNKGNVNARYVVDSVDCVEDIVSNGIYGGIDNSITKVIIDTVKVLNKTEEKMMNFFICRVFELYLDNFTSCWDETEEPFRMVIYRDSGERISITNPDGSFRLFYWNRDETTQTYYGVIRKEIFGEFIY